MQTIGINTKLPMIYNFAKKKICGELAYTRGATGEWVIIDEFSTYVDEIGTFVIRPNLQNICHFHTFTNRPVTKSRIPNHVNGVV